MRAPERPMLIVHVVRQFVASVGGLKDVVRELSKHQVERGFAVRVVRLDRIFRTNEASSETRLPAYEVIKGVGIIRIPYWLSLRYPIEPRVLRHIRTADIVHVHASNVREMVARSGEQGVIAGLLWLPRHFDATGCTLGVAWVPHLIPWPAKCRAHPSGSAQLVWNGFIGSLFSRAGLPHAIW